MPRSKREESETGIYHIVLRGNNLQQIFEDEEDYFRFIDILTDCREASGYRCYGYCVMSNHVHLLLHEGVETLGQIFRRIGVRYVYWYNWKYRRRGHLFQDRFESKPVENDAYLTSVLRYIHMNPVQAGLTETAEEYKWSSAGAYLTNSNQLVNTDYILALFSENRNDQLSMYKEYMSKKDEIAHMDIEDNRRLHDDEAKTVMYALCRERTVSGFQNIPSDKREITIKTMYTQGVSIRQLNRLTGVSIGLIRKYILR